MPGNTRDHEAVVIESFNGWWKRGDDESVPSDHFIQADNVQYFSSGVETRDPLDKWQVEEGIIVSPLRVVRVKRVYSYLMQTGQTLLALMEGGSLYHVFNHTTTYGPILLIPDMDDFGFVAYNGRAYITPFKTYVNAQGVNYELGLKNEFVYVYKGDGEYCRKAGGAPPTGSAMTATNDVAGLTDFGDHLIAVVYETDTGYLTALGPEVFTRHNFSGTNKIKISNIPVSPNTYVKKRHLVATKWIPEYNNDQKGYQFFFIPKGNIDDNTTTEKVIEFFDADLLSDASHLVDNFSEIPAGVNLNTYHSRLVIVGEYGLDGPRAVPPTIEDTLKDLPTGVVDNRSVARVSHPGEPEAISKVTGLIIAPLDGNPLTNVQEFRDILYLFKKSRTYGYADNFDEPSTWEEEVLDQGVGAPVHGIATVLDSGGVNIDFLLVADWSGLMLFNGTYARPEISWKIDDYWMSLDRNNFRHVQIVNNSLNKKVWLTLPDPNRHMMLHMDYSNGMDAEHAKWARWIFDATISTITLIESTKLIVGALADYP